MQLNCRQMKKVILSLLIFICGFQNLHGQQIIEDVGHYTQLGLPISALGISILKGDKEGTYQFLKSFALESIVVIGLKRGINRTRPNGKPYSFPSGHTALSFMSATYLWKRYGWEYGVPSMALAGFVGYSRYGPNEPVHFFSDVVAGAAIGIGSSLLFTRSRNKDLQVNIQGDLSYLGINLKVNLN